MKRIFLLFSMLLLLGLSNAVMAEDTDISALDNAIYIENFEAGIGKQVTISIKMKNSGQIRGYQCDLYLPEGMSFAKDGSNNPIARISGGRTTTEYHALTKSIQDDGCLRLLCNASEVHYFSGNDGEVAQVTVDVSESMAAGNYTISLKNIKMGATSNPEEGTSIDEIKSTVTVAVQNYDVLLDENSTVAPTASDGAVDVLVKRTIKAGNWSTICLPFAMTEAQVKSVFGDDVQLADFTGYDTTEDADENIVGITVNFAAATSIEANHPYIIKVSNDVAEFTVNGVEVSPEDEPTVTFGTTTGKGKNAVYHPMDFNGTYVAEFNIYNAAFGRALFLNNSKFYYATENTKSMKAFRAYFDFDDVLSEVENASANSRIRMSIGGSGNTTKIGNVDSLQANSGRVYSINGQFLGEDVAVETLPKGLYIVNGKKILK